MKVGIVYTPFVSIIDIASLVKTFEDFTQTYPKMEFNYEICSFLPQKQVESGVTMVPTMVGLPLTGFDKIILPGSAGYEKVKMDMNWLSWLQSTGPDCEFFGFHEGTSILNLLNVPNQWQSRLNNPINGFLVGAQILSEILEPDQFINIMKTLGIEPFWQSYLQSFSNRKSTLSRVTTETQINIKLALDGRGKANINTRIPFLDHMLNQITKHGLFDIELTASGDLEIDPHHTMEDCGIILGDAFRQALGEKRGINRMASATVPMDESLATVTIDFSGRPYCVIQSQWNGNNIGDIPVSLFEHFLESFATAARCNLFVQVQAGKDNHHMCEAIFKALAKALSHACNLDYRRLDQIPSTKEKIF